MSLPDRSNASITSELTAIAGKAGTTNAPAAIIRAKIGYSGKEIVISPKHIDRISYEESKMFVNVSKEAILEAPQYHISPLGETYGDTRNFD